MPNVNVKDSYLMLFNFEHEKCHYVIVRVLARM